MTTITKRDVNLIQILFAFALTVVLRNTDYCSQTWAALVVRYVCYFLYFRVSESFLIHLSGALSGRVNGFYAAIAFLDDNTGKISVFIGTAVYVYLVGLSLFGGELVALALVHMFQQKDSNMTKSKESKDTITYGVGMACSFFEGYLSLVLPSDGHQLRGFQANIEKYENRHQIVFPVRKLFIIITSSMFCPPDLADFNKENRPDLPYLEACESLDDIDKDVAGVKNRTYRNSAYSIRRPGASPVYLACECATPLHTLYKVLGNRELYAEIKNINVQKVVKDFSSTLQSILDKSHQCRGKCVLVYFDTEAELNLADVLLEKIKEIEPNFENIKRV